MTPIREMLVGKEKLSAEDEQALRELRAYVMCSQPPEEWILSFDRLTLGRFK